MIDKNNQTIWYQPYGRKDKYTVTFLNHLHSYSLASKISKYKRVIIIADTQLHSSFKQQVASLFSRQNTQIKVLPFVCGDKSLTQVTQIWQQMVSFVPDAAVAIGGGTISDLVGFAASTYQRGIPHVLFPTTLLGMVDASLGGKTGIDFGDVKNSVGTVHYPILVVNALEILRTLPKPEFFSGFAEVVKAAVLFDERFFKKLLEYADTADFTDQNPKLLEIIMHSASLKMKNSEYAPKHKIKLLYGHAVGHALELSDKGTLRHGDAVAVGMIVEGAIACELGIWNRREWWQQTELLRKLHLPIDLPKVSIERIIEKMKLYKKLVAENEFALVLPWRIGDVFERRGNFLIYISEKKFKKLLKSAIAYF